MDADLDLLLTTVFCTADDLLPDRQANAARRVTDAEVVTLCVAQAIMGIPSDRRFLVVARKQLGHLFPELPKQPGYFKRRRRCAETLEWLLSARNATAGGETGAAGEAVSALITRPIGSTQRSREAGDSTRPARPAHTNVQLCR